jgi:hypothetical protein
MEDTGLEFHLVLKHIHQALLQHEAHLKKIHKLQDKIIQQSKDTDDGNGNDGEEAVLSAKAAAKLLQAYETALRSVEGLQDHVRSAQNKMEHEDEYGMDVDDDGSEEYRDDGGDDNEVVSEQMEEPSLQSHELDVEGLDHEEEHNDGNDQMMVDANVEDSASHTANMVDLPAGSLVAVLCRVEEEDSEAEEWILAIVKQFDATQGVYEVEDCEATGEPVPNGKRRVCEASKILHLPPVDESNGDEEEGEFKPKTAVLALFPGTTCLYPAVVISTPSRRRKTRDYLLRFQDDEVPSRTCPARFVTKAI